MQTRRTTSCLRKRDTKAPWLNVIKNQLLTTTCRRVSPFQCALIVVEKFYIGRDSRISSQVDMSPASLHIFYSRRTTHLISRPVSFYFTCGVNYAIIIGQFGLFCNLHVYLHETERTIKCRNTKK